MKKRLIRILSICTLSALLATGCAGEEENSNSPETTAPTTTTTETNTPPAIEEETTTPQYTYSLEDAIAEYEELFDSERLIVKEWFYIDEFGVPGWVPGIVEIDGVEYTYGYGKHGWLTSITGSDGSEITKEIVVDDAGSIALLDKEYKNGKCIDYFENLSSSPNYTGFQYEGKKYMYVFTTYNYNDIITGIKDEEGNIVAEYEYYDDNNRMGIRTINHTEDKLGDVNSFKGFGNYINNDMGFAEDHNSMYQCFSLEYVFENNTIAIPLYLPGHLYGEPETTSKKDNSKYDTDRIEIVEWEEYIVDSDDPLKTTMFRPKKIEVEGVEYTYTYDGVLTSIKGTDGTDIRLEYFVTDENFLTEYKNGRTVKYIRENTGKGYEIIGFEYEGQKYTYVYGSPSRIDGIADENGNIVAKYKYTNMEKGTSIEVINCTDDNIGDVNSLRYTGHYEDEATGFSFYFDKVYNVVNQENVEMIEMFEPTK